MPPEPPTLSSDDLLGGRYRLLRRIARGGMAEVWEAVDVVLDRPVAVKALLPHLAVDDAFLTRFRREAVAAARLSHPHIVAIYDTCASDGCEAIVMELVRGRPLREALDDGGAIPVEHAVEIAAQVASALDHAHRAGLVHRDVKPGNILLADDGRVLVADFGIAKAAEASHDLTEVGEVMGTAKYLSPEQVQGDPVDARSDVYALGVVLYEMLCGRPPFAAANSTATAVARLTTDPLRPRQVRAGIPRRLEDIVLRALARDPERRYQSAAALRAALLAAGVDEPADVDRTAAVPTATPPQPAYARSERSWWVPAALIVVIALTLGTVGVLVGRTEVGRDLLDSVGAGGSTPSADAALTVSASSFDPLSRDQVENDDAAGLAHDGDPSTSWATEGYRSRALGGLKAGVGLALSLDGPYRLATLTLDSPTEGWAGQVFVADGEPPTDLEAWGEAVASVSGEGQRVTVDLGDLHGAAVLLWITDLGEQEGARYQFRLSEASVTGRR